MVSFESLRTVSYSPSVLTVAVSLAISEIFERQGLALLKPGFGVVQGH